MSVSDFGACECCNEQPATQWMEWGEWLCKDCAAEAIEDDSAADVSAERER